MAKRDQHIVPHGSGWIIQGASSLAHGILD